MYENIYIVLYIVCIYIIIVHVISHMSYFQSDKDLGSASVKSNSKMQQTDE